MRREPWPSETVALVQGFLVELAREVAEGGGDGDLLAWFGLPHRGLTVVAREASFWLAEWLPAGEFRRHHGVLACLMAAWSYGEA